jgi:ABC-2 type transport system ATP-binding protein
MKRKKSLTIKTKKLTKKYGEFKAVSDLNLSISKGEIFGLLGPNGSGKTTIILMLLGLTEPTSGELQVLGYDPIRQPFEVKRLVGYLPERLGFYENLTAKQNLTYFARLNRIEESIIREKVSESINQVGLIKQEEAKVNTFSRGMKQRLGIANVLVKDPQLIILDEPTQGIDPKGIQEILHLFSNINKEKEATILLSSHLIHQVQQICDNIGIMSQGKMRVRGSLSLSEFDIDQDWIIEFTLNNISPELVKDLENLPQIRSLENEGSLFTAHCGNDIRAQIAKTVIENGGSLTSLNLQERSLINIYTRRKTNGWNIRGLLKRTIRSPWKCQIIHNGDPSIHNRFHYVIFIYQ